MKLEKNLIKLNKQFSNKEEAIRYVGKFFMRVDMLMKTILRP